MNRCDVCDPTLLVIFGATGDLAKRKLIPALYNLQRRGWLNPGFGILGTGKSISKKIEFLNTLKAGVKSFNYAEDKFTQKEWTAFAKKIDYLQGDLLDQNYYETIEEYVSKYLDRFPKAAVVYYLAVPPSIFEEVALSLMQHNGAKTKRNARLVMEKPFGTDLKSAKALNKLLLEHYDEKQLYRIDHYLGKETVQNIMAFRFANSLFEPLWNRNFIESIQITAAETIGVEGRGGYYDNSGVLRDMIQNHVLQVLCMIAMEPPVSFEADEVRNKTRDVLLAMQPFTSKTVKSRAIRGQYGPGKIDGKKVASYRQEKDVPDNSNTETYAALELYVDNWRWNGVPFYVRSGKRMHRKFTAIIISFKDVPHLPFSKLAAGQWSTNYLVINLQPEMGIKLQIQAKEPGPKMNLNAVDMVFDYEKSYGKKEVADAYQTLLQDVIEGDATLFMRADQVEAAWEIVMPVLNHWQKNKEKAFPNYAAGTPGPEAANKLLEDSGNDWMTMTITKEEDEEN